MTGVSSLSELEDGKIKSLSEASFWPRRLELARGSASVRLSWELSRGACRSSGGATRRGIFDRYFFGWGVANELVEGAELCGAPGSVRARALSVLLLGAVMVVMEG